VTPLDIALALAATGLRVFPCLADKTPATEHGFKDASMGSGAIREMWCRSRAPLIGVPTGAVSGFDVLDLDFRHPGSKTWYDENRHRLPTTRTHQSRSGSPHLLFQHHDTMRCSVSRIAAGIDTRATGGYVIWWPAHGFPILSDAPLAPWPDFLLAEFRPKPRPAVSTTNIIPFRGDGWLRGLVRIVATAPEGQRNRILFWASCRAGEAIHDGKAAEDFVTSVLIEAAARAGLPQPEALRTINSGVDRS
jgi:hypothetical protein